MNESTTLPSAVPQAKYSKLLTVTSDLGSKQSIEKKDAKQHPDVLISKFIKVRRAPTRRNSSYDDLRIPETTLEVTKKQF